MPIRSQEKFLAELGWREFSYSLLYAFPDLATRNWQDKFDAFPFIEDTPGFKAWTRGRTHRTSGWAWTSSKGQT